MAGAPSTGGRFFYRDGFAGFNFERAQISLPLLLEALVDEQDQEKPAALHAGASTMSSAIWGRRVLTATSG